MMTTIEEITAAIQELPIDQLVQVQEWLADYTERQWDQQIESDERSGRLDSLIDRALENHKAGRTKPL